MNKRIVKVQLGPDLFQPGQATGHQLILETTAAR